MKVFNLAEELEKERKKNKELKKRVDFLIDRNDEKEDRINKAIKYIIHENFKRTILVGVGTKKYTRNILDNVLNILKGDNK